MVSILMTYSTNGIILRLLKQSEDFLLNCMMDEFSGQFEQVNWKSRRVIYRKKNGFSVKTQTTGIWLLISRKSWPNGRKRKSGRRSIQSRSSSKSSRQWTSSSWNNNSRWRLKKQMRSQTSCPVVEENLFAVCLESSCSCLRLKLSSLFYLKKCIKISCL